MLFSTSLYKWDFVVVRKLVWNQLIPLKISAFLWRHFNMLPTKDNLFRHVLLLLILLYV
jgi:hypothetical protein